MAAPHTRLTQVLSIAAALALGGCSPSTGVPADGTSGTSDNLDDRSADGGETSGFALTIEMPVAAQVGAFDVTVTRVACAPGDAIDPFETTERVALAGDFVPGASPDLVGEPFDGGSAHPAADQFFVVPAGCYDVGVTALSEGGSPAPDCRAASVPRVEVEDGETTEIVAVVQCGGPSVGALDVIATLNRPPQLRHIGYHPSKLNPACAPVMICATAVDPDGDPMDIEWQHATGPAFAVGPELARLESSAGEITSCIQVVGASPSYHEFIVIVRDLAWHQGVLVPIETLLASQGQPHSSRASLELPLHIGAARDGSPSCEPPPEPPGPCDHVPPDCRPCDHDHDHCPCHVPTSDCGRCDPHRDRHECVCPHPTDDCGFCDPHRDRQECVCPHPTDDCGACDPHAARHECRCPHPTDNCGECDPDRDRPQCGGPICPQETDDCSRCDPNRDRHECVCGDMVTTDCGICDPEPDRFECRCPAPTNDCGACDPAMGDPVCTCDHDTDDCGECDLDRSGCGPECLGGDPGPDGDCDGDGVPNGPEDEWGTNKYDPDSDNDNISDGEEWGDPTRPPRNSDSDDVIDPLDTDSDNDGAPDIAEAGDELLETPAVETNGNGVPEYRDPDRDRDGISDPDDNCPDTQNPDQADGDSDGTGDICDACPENGNVNVRKGSGLAVNCGEGLDDGDPAPLEGVSISLEGGGGCQGEAAIASPGASASPWAALALAGLLALGGRRRR